MTFQKQKADYRVDSNIQFNSVLFPLLLWLLPTHNGELCAIIA